MAQVSNLRSNAQGKLKTCPTLTRKATFDDMPNWFREGFYGGLSLALLIGLFLLWLWRPEHQVTLHSDHLLSAIEHKNWSRFASFLDSDYKDQWGNDRSLVLERTREVFGYVRDVHIIKKSPQVRTAGATGYWRAEIVIESDSGEMMTLVKERVNQLKTPFELQWHRVSGKPWDWKLVRVANEELQIPTEFR